MEEEIYSLSNAREVKYLAKALAHEFRQLLIESLLLLGCESDLRSIKDKYEELSGESHESSYYTQHFNILINAKLVEKTKDENGKVWCSLNKEFFNESTRLIDVLSELNIEKKN